MLEEGLNPLGINAKSVFVGNLYPSVKTILKLAVTIFPDLVTDAISVEL
jgi:hypothetical protein